ncbi:MAG TPA: hypothetical protein VM452_17800 [Caulifigura sp.]|jgi:hypothetical protein|nr:hypothetical protein [Caulifigura sp.]
MASKPVRWKPVAIGLVLLGLFGWRAWAIPRIDGRLVGRWECVTPTPGRQCVTLYLRGNGHGKHAWQEGDSAHVEDYPWAVSGRTLEVHIRAVPGRPLNGLGELVDWFVFLFERRAYERTFESWTLLAVETNGVRMRQTSTGQVQVFRRVPSGLDR